MRPLRWIRVAIAFVLDWLAELVTFAEAETPNQAREAIIEQCEQERFAPKLTSVADEAPIEVREPPKPKYRVVPPKLPVGGVAFHSSTIGAVDEKTGEQGYTAKRRVNPARQGKKALKRKGVSRKEIRRTVRVRRKIAEFRCPKKGCKDHVPHRHVSVPTTPKPEDPKNE